MGIATTVFTLDSLLSSAAVPEAIDDGGLFNVPVDCAADAEAIPTQDTRISITKRTEIIFII